MKEGSLKKLNPIALNPMAMTKTMAKPSAPNKPKSFSTATGAVINEAKPTTVVSVVKRHGTATEEILRAIRVFASSWETPEAV